MLSFGTTDNHSNRVSYGDVAAFDGVGTYTLAIFLRQLAATPSSSRWMINKGGDASNYLLVRAINVGNGIQVRHYDTAADSAIASAGFPTVGTTYSFVFQVQGGTNTYSIYRNAVALSMSDAVMAQNVGASANPITLGSLGSPSSGAGPPVALGHVMFWNGVKLSESEIYQYHSGQSIPQIDKLSFWVKGTAVPGKDEITQNTGSVTGTVSLLSDPVDSYFTSNPFIPAWLEVFSRELRRRRFVEEPYTFDVPLEYLALEILDDLNVSHDSIPRAASILANIDDHCLAEKWRAMYGFNAVQYIDLNDKPSMRIVVPNLEPFICYAWSTDMLPYAVTDEYDGLAQIDQGATWYIERSSSAWVQQADGLIATLPSGVARIGSAGHLPCSGSENPIQNSTFKYDAGGPPYFPGWTLVGGGSFNGDTGNLLFVDDDTYPNSINITKGAGDTYVEQGSLSVNSSDGSRTLDLYYHSYKDIYSGILSFQIERPGPQYWNDSTPGWQGGSVWNNLADASLWTHFSSQPISTPATESWTLRLGIVTGSTSDVAEIGQVQLNEGRYALAPIPTTVGNTYTTETDGRYFEFDDNSTENHRVCAPMRCYTFRCRFVALNDYDRMADDDVLTAGYAQYDSSGDNYDLCCYEKPAGGNHRFAMKRYRHGTLEATAYKDTQISAGTEYEVAFRWLYDEYDVTPTNNARDFDGTNDYYALGADFKENADSLKGIFAARIRIDGGDGTNRYILCNTGVYVCMYISSGNKIAVLCKNSSGTTILEARTVNSYTASTAELSVFISWDLSAGKCHIYVDDISDLNEITNDGASGDIDYTRTNWAVGASPTGGNKWNGFIGNVYFEPGSYLDLDVETNRHLLFRSDGKPEYIGGDGSLVTGAQPILFLPSGNGANNCGRGGQFTAYGSPSAAGLAGPSRALSVFVDGTKGTDTQAESNHACFDHDELCPDPTCATDFWDSKGYGWSHDTTNDEFDCDGTQATDTDLTEGSICVSEWIYRVEFEVKNIAAGNICAVCGTQEGTDRSSNGVYSEYITANGTDFTIRADSNFQGSVTNIYIHRDKYSSFHVGTAPSATGFLPANNYMANPEIIQMAIPDEAIQARR